MIRRAQILIRLAVGEHMDRNSNATMTFFIGMRRTQRRYSAPRKVFLVWLAAHAAKIEAWRSDQLPRRVPARRRFPALSFWPGANPAQAAAGSASGKRVRFLPASNWFPKPVRMVVPILCPLGHKIVLDILPRVFGRPTRRHFGSGPIVLSHRLAEVL